jgi:hypothetical protein
MDSFFYKGEGMSSKKLVSLLEATAIGAKRFFTGVPCTNGHVAERRVVGQHCVECHRINAKRQRQRAKQVKGDGGDLDQASKRQVAVPTLLDGWPTLEMLLQIYSLKPLQAAVLSGSHRYFTGQICKRGHIDLRRVASGSCVACEWLKRSGSNEQRKEDLFCAINGAMAQPALPEWPLVSREEALAQDLPRYYSREICKNGHIGPRYVGNSECALCSSKRNRDRYASDPEFRQHRIGYESERNRRPDVRERRLVQMREYNRRPEVRQRLLTSIKEIPLVKLKWNTKTLLRNTLRNRQHKKETKLQSILGCTIAAFKDHIARQFTKGMTWENYGEWELDHIVPLSSAATGEEVIALFHHTNVRPLWKVANRSKGPTRDFLI